MPLDPITGGLIESGVNAISSIFTNKQNYNNSVKLFNMQHQAAIDDWNRQNEYNSPAQQMGRYKDAGLNPNLIYGNMTNSAPIKTGDVNTPTAEAPRMRGLSESIMMKQQLAQSAAQTNLLTKNAEAAAEDAALKRAQRENIEADTKLKGSNLGINEFQLGQNKLMAPLSYEAQQLRNAETRNQINKIQAETNGILNATEISRIMLEPNKAKVLMETMLHKAQIAKSYAEQKLIQSTIQSNDFQNILRRIEADEKQFNLDNLKGGLPTSRDSYLYRLGGHTLRALDSLKRTKTPIQIYKDHFTW